MADSQLQPGMTATRAEIRNLYGGSSQGGIVPSNTSNSVLLYSDPTVGHRYGYRDGWLVEEDEHGLIFEYTGAGATGDQTFEGVGGSGNRAILNHVEAGRSLRVFTATGRVPGSQTKLHRYVGEFKVDVDQPYVLRQMPDSNGDLRKVIVFRLRPAGIVDRDGRDVIPPSIQTLTSLHSDSSTADDLLGNKAEVDKLSKLVLATTTMPPLAIALLGEWGAGKSSFMAQMDQRIQQLASLSAQAKPNESAFVAHVRQIHFNAWHYSDEHVWSGLIEKLFRDLAQVPEERDDPSESVLAKRAERAAELGKLEHRSEQLDLDLERAARLQPQSSFLAWLSSPREGWLLFRAASRELRAETTAYGLTAITVLVGAAAAIIWGRPVVQPWIAGSLGALLAIPPIAKIWRTIRAWLPGQRKIIDKLRGRLEEIQSDLHSQVTTAQASLAEVDAAVRLADFLTERGSTNSYQGYQGLLSWVHKDLTHLDEALRAAQDEWAETDSNQLPPLQRIILYIDDLDRCPPARVVEVLAAVHLMLALPLFVVVVAVDPRWLVRCLKHHHKELFAEASDMTEEEPEDIATPVDYLDKIFQIPLTVPPTTPEKTSLFLEALLGAPSESDELANTEQANPIPRSGDEALSEGPSAEASTTLGEPLVPSVETDELNPSQMTLTAPEISFMAQLGELVPTPRAAKKLVNLYRLVRVGIKPEDLQGFLSPSPSEPGEHQAVQVLLTLLVGHPEQASPLFKHILAAASSEKITDVLRNSPTQAAIGPRAADVLDKINANIEVRLDVAAYQRWCPSLARYSFYTRRLSG
ncbi:P-loop NTPase fold protein [Streptomyces sp. NPDC051105]|uniref:KAP family P-loop NTPase fold protein n=1 Tax=Streptomyces sp. NPDC051105 TaxID=3154843 RepID=UPI003425D5EA